MQRAGERQAASGGAATQLTEDQLGVSLTETGANTGAAEEARAILLLTGVG